MRSCYGALQASWKNHQCLHDMITDPLMNSETKTEAATLLKKILFIVLSCYRHKVLDCIDIVNKLLLKEDISVDHFVKWSHHIIRENSATEAIQETKYCR